MCLLLFLGLGFVQWPAVKVAFFGSQNGCKKGLGKGPLEVVVGVLVGRKVDLLPYLGSWELIAVELA